MDSPLVPAHLKELLNRLNENLKESLNQHLETLFATFLAKVEHAHDGSQANDTAQEAISLHDIVANITAYLEETKAKHTNGEAPFDETIDKKNLLETVFKPSVSPKEPEVASNSSSAPVASLEDAVFPSKSLVKEEVVTPPKSSPASRKRARETPNLRISSTSASNNVQRRPPPVPKYTVLSLKCPIPGCPFSVKQSAQLQTHLFVVHRCLPFRCEVAGCGASFHTDGALKTHLSTNHSSLTYWQCSQCRATLPSHTSLSAHIQRFHNQGLFQCSACPYVATVRGDFFRHSTEVHFKEYHDYRLAATHANNSSSFISLQTPQAPAYDYWRSCSQQGNGQLSTVPLWYYDYNRGMWVPNPGAGAIQQHYPNAYYPASNR